jgi:L-fuconolactonase
VIDSHVHTWPVWPYSTSRRDGNDDVALPRLLGHLDRGGIDACWLIAAELPGAAGLPGADGVADNAYAADAALRHPDRIRLFLDADSRWSSAHHRRDAPERLRALLDRFPGASGVTHYVEPRDDGWFESTVGLQWLTELRNRGLVLSLAVTPDWYGAISRVARDIPGLPFVLHHLAGATSVDDLTDLPDLRGLPNVAIKLSGGHYLRRGKSDIHAIVQKLADTMGPERLIWGSDFPVDGKFLSRDEVDDHCSRVLAGFGPDELQLVTHGNAERLTARAEE